MMRTSEEILKDITHLFSELSEAQKEERRMLEDRIDYLDIELQKQKQKQKDIAHILLRE
jgi:hypothetical protein